MTGCCFLFAGTYTRKMAHVNGRAAGIYVYSWDPATAGIKPVHTATGIVNPSFLAVHPGLPVLYAVSEIDDYDDKCNGAVAAFAVNPVNGSLRLLNMRQSFGSGPCHVSIGKKGDVLALANYGSGSIALFELNSDGSLGTEKSVIQHRGSSVNPGRQEGPHPHSANFNPEDNRVIVPDLGLDALLVYEIDRGRLALKPEPERFPSRPGAGPRHLAFHPDLRHAYVSNELDSTVTVLTYNREDFSFKAVQVISALPAGTEVFSTSADIHIHPSGGFLYVSNRGHDSIAVFTVNRTDGSLTAAGHEPTRGRTPRNFLVSEDGRFLLAANQDTDTVATFAINDKTGGLSHVRTEEILSPVCLVTRCY